MIATRKKRWVSGSGARFGNKSTADHLLLFASHCGVVSGYELHFFRLKLKRERLCRDAQSVLQLFPWCSGEGRLAPVSPFSSPPLQRSEILYRAPPIVLSVLQWGSSFTLLHWDWWWPRMNWTVIDSITQSANEHGGRESITDLCSLPARSGTTCVSRWQEWKRLCLPVTAGCTSIGQLSLAFWEGNVAVGGGGNFHK